jgi:phage replication-related protein YjqB (UPF0714/DUF867 family)
MSDRYESFDQLARQEREGVDFQVRWRVGSSAVAIIAPHGGAIEPGTSEVAWQIADGDCSVYSFEGLKGSGNSVLHITSVKFDEQRCVSLMAECVTVLTVHGERSESEAVFLGGADLTFKQRVREALSDAGFAVQSHVAHHLQGRHESNICNKGTSGKGVQLELSRGLRTTFFESLSPLGRANPSDAFRVFCAAVRTALPQR